MTTTTETQVPELTALDTAGISHLAWMISEHAVEGTPIEEMNAELYDALTNYFTDPENRLLARFMGAALVERAVWGDRAFGQDDPPVGGFLGKAIDKVIEDLEPLAGESQPWFFQMIYELAGGPAYEARGASGALISDLIPGAEDLQKLVDEEVSE